MYIGESSLKKSHQLLNRIITRCYNKIVPMICDCKRLQFFFLTILEKNSTKRRINKRKENCLLNRKSLINYIFLNTFSEMHNGG